MITAMCRHSGSCCRRLSVRTMNVLLVERIRVARVSVLVGRRLEERHGGQVAGARRLPEPREVVEVLRLVGLADHGHRRRRQMQRVGGRGEVLERVVMRHVVRECAAGRSRDRRRPRGRTPRARWLVEHLPSASSANPPWNQPHVTPAAVSRSPMLRPVSAAGVPLRAHVPERIGVVDEGAERRRWSARAWPSTTPGRRTRARRRRPRSAARTARRTLSPTVRFSAPRVDWPDIVAKLLSHSAKCCA